MSERPEYREVRVLLVEDDDVDAEAIERAFRKARIANPIVRVHDGIEAVDTLRENGVDRPFLVLLDLNMPRMDGIEFLKAIRADTDLHDTIVFVLTTSNDDQDKIAAYQEHVAGYMVKARAGDDFVNLIQMLDHYWRVVEFPPKGV